MTNDIFRMAGALVPVGLNITWINSKSPLIGNAYGTFLTGMSSQYSRPL